MQNDPKRPVAAQAALADTRIAYAKIHPGIGVARVGNSDAEGSDGYYIGPEYPSLDPSTFPPTRDAAGAIKRQAARFRIYGYNAAGEVVQELTPDNASITWTVRLANRKAQWYVFDAAMDLPAAPVTVNRRNPLAAGAGRDLLAIDSGPVSIGAADAGSQNISLLGRFQSPPPQGQEQQTTIVWLGALLTDQNGRLLVLGGKGLSLPQYDAPLLTIDQNHNELNFNNSPNWFDDTSDGPVKATVSIDGVPIEVTPSWVIVTPPNFAPGMVSVRTLYDVARDAMIEAGQLQFDTVTSFQRHILPTLMRLSSLQWTNAGFAQLFGKGTGSASFDFGNIEYLTALSTLPASGNEPDNNASERQRVFQMFRPPGSTSMPTKQQDMLWPPLYGDTLDSAVPKEGSDFLAVTPELYERLQDWAKGDFTSDYDPDSIYTPPEDRIPLAQRPALLDAGPLSDCIADAFHPGCELTWPMRHATMYSELARILPRGQDTPERDYGDTLTSLIVQEPGGPLYGQAPGGLTRWMALPWQGDTARCRSGYDPDLSPYLPSFWPARVPNQVLLEDDYDIFKDPTYDLTEQRIPAFQKRAHWNRNIIADAQGNPLPNEQVMQNMVHGFQHMGTIEQRPCPPDLLGQFPAIVWVEILPGAPAASAAAIASTAAAAKAAKTRFSIKLDNQALASERAERLRQAGWASEAQLESFKRLL
jgi:hypothetical protein